MRLRRPIVLFAIAALVAMVFAACSEPALTPAPTATRIPIFPPTATPVSTQTVAQPTITPTTTVRSSQAPTPTRSPTAVPTVMPSPLATLSPTQVGPTRSFALGFTDFPHEVSIPALVAAYEVIERDGDLMTMHFDDGIPWPEALAGDEYNAEYMAEVNGKAGIAPPDHVMFLAITPISFDRDALASYRGQTVNEPLPAPWDSYSFDHPDVIEAFIKHAERMIAIYSPDYFAYAIEANILYHNRPDLWPAFLTFAESVYSAIKESHPNLPIFVTLQAEWFNRDRAAQTAGINHLLPFTDMISVSSYPFIDAQPVAEIPVDYFSSMADLAPGKPFAISETSWPAEDVTDPYPVLIPGSPESQQQYVERLFNDAEALEAQFINWFFTRDFDKQWEDVLSAHPAATTLRLWRDTGLYDGEGSPRIALDTWREALLLPRI